jgi:hypothetical protein
MILLLFYNFRFIVILWYIRNPLVFLSLFYLQFALTISACLEPVDPLMVPVFAQQDFPDLDVIKSQTVCFSKPLLKGCKLI